jgi:hypothetical protein
MSQTQNTAEAFTLVKERVFFAHMNLRSEKHGDESEPALDVKFELTTANSVLKKLSPDLLDALYDFDKQADVEDDFKRKLKFPLLGVLPWDLELPRTMLTVHDVDGNDITLYDGKTNKLRIEALDGGTVKLVFRCQFSAPDEDAVASLMRVLQQDVPISLESVALAEKPDNFQQADLLSQEPHSAARQEAESLFNPVGAQSPEDLLELAPEPAPEV